MLQQVGSKWHSACHPWCAYLVQWFELRSLWIPGGFLAPFKSQIISPRESSTIPSILTITWESWDSNFESSTPSPTCFVFQVECSEVIRVILHCDSSQVRTSDVSATSKRKPKANSPCQCEMMLPLWVVRKSSSLPVWHRKQSDSEWFLSFLWGSVDIFGGLVGQHSILWVQQVRHCCKSTPLLP